MSETRFTEKSMSHQLPEFGYIMDFLGCIIGVIIVAHIVAAVRGFREK